MRWKADPRAFKARKRRWSSFGSLLAKRGEGAHLGHMLVREGLPLDSKRKREREGATCTSLEGPLLDLELLWCGLGLVHMA